MTTPRKIKFYNAKTLDKIEQVSRLPKEEREAMTVVAQVLPFRVNNYVVEDLIDWDNIPDDPIFQLTFPQRGMLGSDHFERMAHAFRSGSKEEINQTAHEIRLELNPHPAGQKTANVPTLDDEAVPGVQHKYRETVLVFPSSGQTCHAYCTFCFRWPQFVGMDELKFATDESRRFQDYLRRHHEVTDVLVTGGDPMIMSSRNLRSYLEPLLEPEFDHIRSIRIGTKSVAYWPYRFVTDKDADDVLRLFEQIVAKGKHLAIMGHHSHWVEFSTPMAHEALRRIRNTGAQYRTQSPVIAHVNDSADVWTRMWQTQVSLGLIPYYMFIERDTGASGYFEVPLYRTYEIYKDAYSRLSGLARTARGPSMSSLPGKICIEGITEVHGETVFVLNFLQGRNPDWVKRPFFAKFDPSATWLTDLTPALGAREFFFERELAMILEHGNHTGWKNASMAHNRKSAQPVYL